MAAPENGPKGATERPSGRLRIPLSLKFVGVLVTLVALLLFAAASVTLWHGFMGAQRSALAIQQEKAEALVGRIDSVLGGLQSQLEWTAQPDWKTAGIEQQRADFARMLRQFPTITELYHIDDKGAEQLKVSRLAPDSIASQTSYANEPRFQETVKTRTWFGPVYVRNGAELSGTIGVAHADGGATIAELDLAFLSALAKDAAGEGGQAFVVDGDGRLIGHPEKNLAIGENDLSGLPQVAAALAGGDTGTSTDAAAEADGAPALSAFARVPGAGWAAIVEEPEAGVLAPFMTLLWQTALVSLAGLLVAAAVGISLARRVTVPIKRLQASAERLGEGDLTQRAAVRRRDEIGALADKFNAMAGRLQQSQKGFEEKIDDRAQGQDIAQQQHTLTVDMLKTISRTDYRLERVLDTLIGSAVRLTDANVGAVWLRQGDAFRLAAQLGHTNDWAEAARKTPFTAGSETHAMAAAAAFSGQVINVDDVLRDVRFAGDYGERPAYSDERSALALPLKHAGRVEAVFALSRGDPLPFTDRQVALAQDFADQALIAVRHMLLLDEVETRDRKLARSSDEQAATDEISRAVAKSPADSRPVLDAIVRSAARLCDAPYCHIESFDGERLHFKAAYGLPPEAIELANRTFPAEPLAGTAAARALETEAAAEMAEMPAGDESGALSALLGTKSAVAVPLLKGGQPVGVLTIERQETGALPSRQIELLKTFADQAAVALESARLSDELRTRTSRLATAIERETATGALLHTVSRIDYDLDGVLAGLADRATRECAADEARFFRLDGEVLRDASGAEAAAEGLAGLARRVLAEAATVNLSDARQDPGYGGKDANRSVIGIPLLAKGVPVGAMTLARRQTQPFGQEQADLAAELADQAALAVAGMQLPAQLADRTAERDDWRQRHASDTEAAEQRRTSEMDEARQLHDAELGEARRLHTTEVAETRERYEAELDETRRLHGEELAERTAERDDWRERHAADTEAAEQRRVAEMDETQQSHAMALAEARRLHVAEVQEAHQQREAELAEAERQRVEQLDGTNRTHATELAETIGKHSAELVETRHLHAMELSEARSLHEADLDLARQQRTATAEALNRLADPSVGLDTVLQSVVGSAVRASSAAGGVLFGRSGDQIQPAAHFGFPDDGNESMLSALRDRIAAEVIAQGEPLHLKNVSVGDMGTREAIGAPLVKEGTALGALVLLGDETTKFGEEVDTLAGSFADQAVIAIETERLLELTALRADQLDEARRFREAAARVLATVGGVEADPQPALDAVVTTAAELCQARSVEIGLAEGGSLHAVATAGASPGDISAAGRALADGRTVHVAVGVDGATLAIPLMLGGKAGGVLALQRQTAFSDGETELADTLSALAAVAIAKSRLAVALAERTQSLDRSLTERETTAQMLATLGRSRFDLHAVLETLARSAAEFSGAGMSAILLDDGTALGAGVPRGWPGDGTRPEATHLAERAMREATPLHEQGDSAEENTLAVPLASANRVFGALVVVRPTAFGDGDTAMVSTIADQAAIAIENVRLLDEVRARTNEFDEVLREQAATADGLKAIGRSAFELDGVLPTLAASAAALSGATTSAIHLLKEGAYHLAAAAGVPAERIAAESANPGRPVRSSWAGRAAIEKTIIHVADTANDIEYPEIEKTADVAAVLSVPLLRDGLAVGAFTLTRQRPGPFTERQIGLVQSFADQASIAAETVRLAEEVGIRAADVNETLRQQTAIAYVLRTIARSSFNLDRVLGTLTTSAATLCAAVSSEIYRLDGENYRLSASTGASPQPGMEAWLRRAAAEKVVVHVPDLAQSDAGTGAVLCMPLLRDDGTSGVFALTRAEPFTERQIELVRSFADQATLAVETARLADAAQASADGHADSLRNLSAVQKRVAEMERLASLGQTTSGIAGEIRSSLDSLRDFSDRSNRLVNDIRMVLEGAVLDIRLREEVEELGDTLKANLDKVVEFGKRADSVVVNTLKLDEGKDGAGTDEHQPVDINALVDESLGIAYHGARAERPDIDVRLERTYDTAAGTVDLNPQEMTRALTYIFTNGFEAVARRKAEMNGSGYQPVLAVSTRNLGDTVEIAIRDNGTGIPPEVKARIFDPFFTTRPAGEGTGLSLSLSRDLIVTGHSGTVDVDTAPGVFTEFRILLPREGVSSAKRAEEHRETPEVSLPEDIGFLE